LAGAPDGWEPDSCEAEGGAALPLSSRTAFETDNGVAVNPAIAVELQLTSAVALDPPVGSLCAEVNSTGARVILWWLKTKRASGEKTTRNIPDNLG
jgi:hypothetical protein